MKTQTKAELAISRARAALVLDQPFFGTLALRLDIVTAPERTRTMATDGRALYYDPAFVEPLSGAALKGVVAHEIMHNALCHHTRRQSRDPRRWNRAADFAINPILIDSGFTLPEGGLIDPQYAGLSAEQIYGRLPADPPGGGKGAKPGAGGAGDGEPLPGEVWDAPGEDGAPASPAELATAEADWQIAVLQAAQAAKAAGKLPGFAATIARAIRAPEIDWRDALRRYMTSLTRADYSWRRPNVRHLATGDYLPSLYSEAMGEVMIAVDTSGSVSDGELAAFASEVNAILEDVRPELVRVVYCDAAIQGEAEFAPEDYPVTLECPGRGGTRFSPVWAWAAERALAPVCAIYLTDLEASDFGDAPEYPVLWVSTGATAAPFGEVVRLRLAGQIAS